jgi:hypothetical protein
MTELALESPAPQRCSATTKAGKPCKAYALEGKAVCLTHNRTPEEREQAARKASARSAEVRAGIVKEREDALRRGQLGLKALMGQRLEAEAEEVTERLRALALSDDDATALRGIELWLSRVYGRPIQPTQEVTVDMPVNWDELNAMTPEQRRALLRATEG